MGRRKVSNRRHTASNALGEQAAQLYVIIYCVSIPLAEGRVSVAPVLLSASQSDLLF